MQFAGIQPPKKRWKQKALPIRYEQALLVPRPRAVGLLFNLGHCPNQHQNDAPQQQQRIAMVECPSSHSRSSKRSSQTPITCLKTCVWNTKRRLQWVSVPLPIPDPQAIPAVSTAGEASASVVACAVGGLEPRKKTEEAQANSHTEKFLLRGHNLIIVLLIKRVVITRGVLSWKGLLPGGKCSGRRRRADA